MSFMDQFRLDGKTAVITGSGQGIGRGIAWGLADAGCDVALNARRENDLEETARGVTERGQEALVFASDIRDKSEELADLTMERFGKIDIWVNNVGGSDEKNTRTLIDTPDEIFRSQLELNLTTAFQGAKAAGATSIVGVDVNPKKYEMAKKLGCTDCVNPMDYDAPIHAVLVEKFQIPLPR